MITAASTGFFSALSLILAIGAQNAFVLRQGMLHSHVFWICMVCALSDAILIALGVVGFGKVVELYSQLPKFMALAGAAFLIFYGASKFFEAFKGDYAMVLSGKPRKLIPALLTCLALTWLNPHVYLDTLGLIGAISTQFPDRSEKIIFGAAAVSASFLFFFSLGYGASLLAPIMQSARAWQVLDVIIAIVMWMIALGLIFHG